LGLALPVLSLPIRLITANGAPQQAAGAAMALAYCIIPYVFTRALHAVAEYSQQSEMLDLQRQMLDRYKEMLITLNAIREGEEVIAAHEIIERTGT
jgi:hypothetical protein